MAPIAAERVPLEPERSRRPPDWMKGQGHGPASELGAATAGPASWIPRYATTATLPLCRFGNFMKKKGRSGTAGAGIAGGYCSPDTWRLTSLGNGGSRLGLGGGRENGMMKGGGSRSGSELWPRPTCPIILFYLFFPAFQFHFTLC